MRVCVRACVCVQHTASLVNVQALPSCRHSLTVAVDIYILVHSVCAGFYLYNFMPVSIGRSSEWYLF